MLLIGKAPNVKWKVDFTPIDFASKSIVSYLQDANCRDVTYLSSTSN